MKQSQTVNQQELAKFQAVSAKWWDKNGPLKTLHDINPIRLEFIKRHMKTAGKRILDVGCGGGILSESLAKLGADVTAIDAQPDVIAAANAHLTEDLTVQYFCSAIEDFESEPFHAISCMEMLEHVDSPDIVIQHCARLLAPGGYLFLSTINRNLMSYAGAIVAAEYLLQLLPKQTHDYDKFMKPSELAASVRHAGLEVIDITGVTYNPITRAASFEKKPRINYLMACYKPTGN